MGLRERQEGVKPESEFEKALRERFNGEVTCAGKGGKSAKGGKGQGRAPGGSSGEKVSGIENKENAWGEDHPLVARIKEVCLQLREAGVDDDPLVTVVAGGLAGEVSVKTAEQLVKGYEGMLEVEKKVKSAKKRGGSQAPAGSKKKAKKAARSGSESEDSDEEMVDDDDELYDSEEAMALGIHVRLSGDKTQIALMKDDMKKAKNLADRELREEMRRVRAQYNHLASGAFAQSSRLNISTVHRDRQKKRKLRFS